MPGPVPPRGSGPAFFRRRLVLAALVLLTSFLISLPVATYLVQRMITFPTPPAGAWQPSARAASGGEQIWLDVQGARVEAWFLPGAVAGPAPLLIYSHGNGELIDMRADEFTIPRAAGIGVLMVEYPGYGRSGGAPSEESLSDALVAAYDWARRDARVDSARILGHGRSLGSGAITQLAARRPLAALILESSFENFEDVVMHYGVPRWLLVNHFNSRAVIEKYPGPVLLLHGTRDRTFPAAHAQRLVTASPRARLHLENCGHNDCPRQWELVLSFLADNGVCRNHSSAENSDVAVEKIAC